MGKEIIGMSAVRVPRNVAFDVCHTTKTCYGIEASAPRQVRSVGNYAEAAAKLS